MVQLNEEMLINKNNTLQAENESLKAENESLKAENDVLKKDRRLLQGRIELLAAFVKNTSADYDSLLNNFVSDKKDAEKNLYIKLYEEFKEFKLF